MFPNNKVFTRRRRISAALTAITFILSANIATAAGDAEAGAKRAGTCAACHGMDGNSVNPSWPSIAGQNAEYLIDTLKAFKEGTRSDLMMGAQAAALSDEDIVNLAAYFASQTPARRTADAELAAAGQDLYRGGNMETAVSACIACHGPNGRGNGPAGYPALAGQHAAYTAKQLNDYQGDARTSDGDAQVMRNVSARLTKDEINAVAAYLQGLN